MKRSAIQMWQEDDGVLSFEWTLLFTLVTFGIISGLAAARDAVIDELGDVAQAMQALDGSYTIDLPLVFVVDGQTIGGASDSGYIDAIIYTDCDRSSDPTGQNPQIVEDGDS